MVPLIELAVGLGALAVAVTVACVSKSARVAAVAVVSSAVVLAAATVGLLASVPARGIVGVDHLLLLNHLGVWVILCLAIVYLCAAVYSVGYLRWVDVSTSRHHWYYALLAGFALVMLLSAVQNNPALYWIAIDLTTLVSALAVGFEENRRTIEAAWRYLIIVSAGLSLALLGTFIFYLAGTHFLGPSYRLSWHEFSVMAPHASNALLIFGFLLLLAGFGTKVGLVPFHTWLPDAHSEGPAPVSAMLSGALLNCAMLGIVRSLSVLAGTRAYDPARTVLVVVGLASVVVATLFLVRQRVVKRLAAYSSIEQMGMIAVGFGFGGPFGVLGALYVMLAHSLTKPLVFFGSGIALYGYGSRYIGAVTRFGKAYPYAGILWLIGAVAITGAPPFAVFLGELVILRGGLDSQNLWVVWILGVLLVIIFIAFLGHFLKMFFGRQGTPKVSLRLSWEILVPMTVLAAAVLVLGVWWPHPMWTYFLGISRSLRGA